MVENANIILLPLIPLLGFLINGFLYLLRIKGKKLPEKLSAALACLAPLSAFLLAISLFLFLVNHSNIQAITAQNLFTWMDTGDFKLSFGFVLDHLSSIMVLLITGVGFLIHLYSTAYMHGDAGYVKYFAYLNLFVFFMLILVLGDSLPILFVGWEGVGLCSYLLIGFWFTDEEKAKAGKKAFITNRVGDFAFLIGMFAIFAYFSNFEASEGQEILSFAFLKQNAKLLTLPVATFITMMLFIGATGKSAQIPLYVWLPDAMAGPTPVSALIHAATMVTAGIYLIARLSFVFVMAPFTMGVIATIGLLTAFFAALIAMTQYDIKKVLAYSTVSQLGYMFLALGVGAFSGSVFHVFTHAFFKACLFLGAGSVIHSLHHEQDMRNMGGLWGRMPITAMTFLISVLAIAGFPFTSGFFSKDEILYLTYANAPHKAYYGLALFTAGLTAFYMMRLFVRTFLGKTNYKHPEKIHESPLAMTIPLMILAILALGFGFVGLPHIIGHNYFGEWLAFLGQITPLHIEGSVLQEMHLMVISSVVATVGLLKAYLIYTRFPQLTVKFKRKFAPLYDLICQKFKIDELYSLSFIKPIFHFSKSVLHKIIDVSLIDDALVNGSGYFSQFVSQRLVKLQTGLLGNYLIYILCGFLVMLFFLIKLS